ncbi:acyltransferase family protein [Bradyrhizobium sp. NBAIM03]|uniref:nodulation factor fucose acetyltransferase NolL n=1 Tax=Bradyrhizobium sp. NBAIM03 TaxID=2793816 RepID=UPI001CD631EA|nr:nodulation factor fucose acetyltransferase NolL [Bradyrhizobium sp. NBAIM03]MCA1536198.1 acyltransferase family protein [Bradyrhizobium sp. NBAIM03]
MLIDHVTGKVVPETAHDRDLALDFTKGVLIILVIAGHLIQYILYQNEGFWDSACFKWIYMFHMPLFMAISGYLSCRALLAKSFTQAIGSRATQLLVPMLFWCSLLESLKFAVFPRSAGAPDTVLQFLNEFVGTYWFVWAAFICFILTKTISIFNRWLPWALFVSVILVVLAPLTFSIFPLIKYMYPFFCLGFLFAQSRERWTSIMRSHRVFLIMSASIAAMMCFLAWRNDTYVYNNLALVQDLQSAKNVLLMFLGSAAASVIMIEVLLRCWNIGRSNRVVRFIAEKLGPSTLVLYLIQGTVFRLMDSIQYGELWDPTMRSAAAAFLGTTIVAVALAVRWTVRDIPYLSQLMLGVPPRSIR